MSRLRADLHIHSTVSDGRLSPSEIVLEAARRELNVISITDHDTFEGSLRAVRYAKPLESVLVIIGAEIRCVEGDILVYCREPLRRIPRSLGELVDYAHAEGCIVVPAHPFDIRRKGIGELVYRYRWDAIEVYNAYADPLANRRAWEAAKEMGLPGLASSDAHVGEAIGAAYTLIDAEPDIDDVFEAIRKGLTKPVPGRPSLRALASTLVWSVERRMRRGKKWIDTLWEEV